VNKIFLKQDTGKAAFPGLPKNIPVINLFRENPYEIGI
jgi:hypothetical protein